MIAVVFLLVLLAAALIAAATGGEAVPVMEILALTGVFVVFFGAGVYIAAVLGLLGILIGLTFSDRPWWAFAATLVDEWRRAGVTDVVLAPGSRSTPLALAVDAAPLRLHVHLDERSAAFFALGLALATGRPAPVVVTSGTAAGIGLGANVYAKTGTADIQGQEQPNSWLIAFDPAKDVAVACLVVNAGYGAQFAGPEVNAFLGKY